jgi:hypothetical protein
MNCTLQFGGLIRGPLAEFHAFQYHCLKGLREASARRVAHVYAPSGSRAYGSGESNRSAKASFGGTQGCKQGIWSFLHYISKAYPCQDRKLRNINDMLIIFRRATINSWRLA